MGALMPFGSRPPIAVTYLIDGYLLLQMGCVIPRTLDFKVLYIKRVERKGALVNACGLAHCLEGVRPVIPRHPAVRTTKHCGVAALLSLKNACWFASRGFSSDIGP